MAEGALRNAATRWAWPTSRLSGRVTARRGTSNGSSKAISGRLEHLRASALGSRILTKHIARRLPTSEGQGPTTPLIGMSHVTTGPGAEARAALSKAEYEWWRKDDDVPLTVSAADRAGADDGGRIEQELFEQFYVVDASLGRLTVTLRQYFRRRSPVFGRSKDYRRLLAWHAGIHLAWVVWFVAIHAETQVDKSDGVSRLKVSPDDRLFGAWGRAHDALRLIGSHRTERYESSARDNREVAESFSTGEEIRRRRKNETHEKTVRGFATAELQRWIDNAEANHSARKATEIKAVVFLAKDDLGLDITIPKLVLRAFPEHTGADSIGSQQTQT